MLLEFDLLDRVDVQAARLGELRSTPAATPYDLVLPYRTDELEWHVDSDMVTTIHLGNDGLLEQIMFSEDSMRGPVTVRAQDRDPKEGLVHVARWDFMIAP